jgi:hypothetical protein
MMIEGGVLAQLSGAAEVMPPLSAVPIDPAVAALAPEIRSGVARHLQRFLPDVTLTEFAWTHPAEPVRLVLTGPLRLSPSALAARLAGFLGVAVSITDAGSEGSMWGPQARKCHGSAAAYGGRFHHAGDNEGRGHTVFTDDSLRSHAWLAEMSVPLFVTRTATGPIDRYGDAPAQPFRCDGLLAGAFSADVLAALKDARAVQLAVAGVRIENQDQAGESPTSTYTPERLTELDLSDLMKIPFSTRPTEILPKLSVLADRLDAVVPRDVSIDLGLFPRIILTELHARPTAQRQQVESEIRLEGGADLQIEWFTHGESCPVAPAVLRFIEKRYSILAHADILPRPPIQQVHEVFMNLRDWVRLESIPALIAIPSPGRILIVLPDSVDEQQQTRLLKVTSLPKVNVTLVAAPREKSGVVE